MKFKILTTIIVSVFFSLSASATDSTQQKNGYKIEVNAPFKKGSTAYFARYWQGLIYATDSIMVPENGIVTISNTETELATGQYMLYIAPEIQIDLLLDKGQNNIKIDLNKEKIIKSTITGSNDTKLFWEYIDQTSKMNVEIEKLNNTLADEDISEATRNKTLKAYLKAEKEKIEYTNKQIKKNEGSWFATIVKATNPVQLPHTLATNKEQQVENTEYIQKHYFDNIDLTDTRLWNTNILTAYIDGYLDNWITQHPDTIAHESSWIVSQTTGNEDAFQKMLSFLSNRAMTSYAMGMENTWAKLAEDYIFDKNLSWIDSTQYNNIKAEYALIEHNRMGMRAQNLDLLTITADSISTNKIEAEYTVLYFYSTSCGHCRTEMPHLRHDFFEKNKNLGVKVIAINLDRDIEAWESFMVQNNLQNVDGWINAFDPNYKSEYWMKYDTSGTPSLYLLGKDKTIIGKKLGIENLDKYFDMLTKK